MNREEQLFFVTPSIAMGGIERAAVNTANGQHAMGCQVIFFSLFKNTVVLNGEINNFKSIKQEFISLGV